MVRQVIGALCQMHVYYVQLILRASAVAAVVRKVTSTGILLAIYARCVLWDRVTVIAVTAARVLAIGISICYLALVWDITRMTMMMG